MIVLFEPYSGCRTGVIEADGLTDCPVLIFCCYAKDASPTALAALTCHGWVSRSVLVGRKTGRLGCGARLLADGLDEHAGLGQGRSGLRSAWMS